MVCYHKTKSLQSSKCTGLASWEKHTHMIISKWFRFIIAKIYNILRYAIPHVLRHMCNLHIKETKISQKQSKGIKNWKITYSVILSILSNKTNLILGYSSPLIDHGEQPMKMQSRYRIKKNIISHAIVPTNQHGRRRMGGRYHQKY